VDRGTGSAAEKMSIRETIILARWRDAEAKIYPLVMVDPALYEAAVAAVANACDQLRSRYGARADLLAVDVDAFTIELAEASEDFSRLAAIGIGFRLVCEAALAHRFMELSG
jgi:hypothetical protein